MVHAEMPFRVAAMLAATLASAPEANGSGPCVYFGMDRSAVEVSCSGMTIGDVVGELTESNYSYLRGDIGEIGVLGECVEGIADVNRGIFEPGLYEEEGERVIRDGAKVIISEVCVSSDVGVSSVVSESGDKMAEVIKKPPGYKFYPIKSWSDLREQGEWRRVVNSVGIKDFWEENWPTIVGLGSVAVLLGWIQLRLAGLRRMAEQRRARPVVMEERSGSGLLDGPGGEPGGDSSQEDRLSLVEQIEKRAEAKVRAILKAVNGGEGRGNT